jgi:hypothetical protein
MPSKDNKTRASGFFISSLLTVIFIGIYLLLR